MTTYASFDYYEGHARFLTPGKLYEVFNENHNGFHINDDKGVEIYCVWRDCAHIHDRDWTRHVELKQTRYAIYIHGVTVIEHVIDYSMDSDMLYAAGTDFEHYYRMKPGDLVTITEMED